MTESTKRSTGALRFDVDCGLLFQLGEELVARRSVALAELIKNAYDADAASVAITFRNVRRPRGEIIVADTGNGMRFEEIQRSWMRIATSEKVRHPFSERYGRPRAGAKGIGRFAARRLAQQLVLVSVALADPHKPREGRERTVVYFNWKDFSAGKLVQDIPVSFRRTHLPDVGPTGVTLRLRGVRDAWTPDDVRALRNDLLKLISPLPRGEEQSGRGHGGDPGFLIDIKSKEFPEEAGSLSENFLRNAFAVLEGELTKAGAPEYTVTFRGRKPQTFSPPDNRFAKVGAAKFTVHFFVYKKDRFAGLPINVRQAQQLGREQGGVRVYVDHFRVPPYGDPGDDWLKLDEDRAGRLDVVPEELKRLAKTARPMLALPGNNQVFGSVFLSRFTNANLHQTANRERLLENEAFRELHGFVRLGIDWLTVLYAREAAVERESLREERKSPIHFLSQAEAKIEEAAEDIAPERRAQIIQAIHLAKASLQEEEKDQISELSMLRVLASTGTMIVVFDHQLMGVLEGLRESHRNLQAFLRKMAASDRDRFQTVLNRLLGWIEDAGHQGELLGLLLGRRARLRRRRLAIRPIAGSVAAAFANYMRDTGIEFRNEVPPELRTPPMFECELSAILINLMTNSLKAVREQPRRALAIEGSKSDHQVSVRFMDTGVGAEPSKWEEYFKPFVGESEPDPLLGSGTGLGLKIVKDFVDVYGGTARFVTPEKTWKTCIEVTLPEESQ
jgi:signal transduction histidine kinase/anti-sigma regulatory factor (Ser/Thr protein kinase)